MTILDPDQIKFLNNIVLGKNTTEAQVKKIVKRINNGDITPRQYLLELFLSAGFGKFAAEKALEFHLYYIHNARIQLVSSMLPPAERILDLGGANGSIVDMGYQHQFKRITVVDLPPEDRDDMYKNIKVKPVKRNGGIIDVHFGDMSDLSFVADGSVDLVWSGESIEHIQEQAADKMLKEAFRVLKPGGFFCVDTPNRILTEIHTKGLDFPFIHPEHKIEYYPKDLQKKLKRTGFHILESIGVREMPNTFKSGVIDYTDFINGKALGNSITSSYIQYYCCQKPLPLKLQAKKIGGAAKHRARSIQKRVRS